MRTERVLLFTFVSTLAVAVACADERKADTSESLSMSPAVACREIKGYEDYEPLPEASLTADEKLVVYYRPLHFRSELKEGRYRAHLIQDGQIRRRGEKAVLQRKEKLLEYEPESDQPIGPLYLRNVISLKELKPGDYDLDIILHDQLGKGREAEARQILKFRVVAAVLPEPKEDAEPSN